jgi:uncharacterized DUF497 family protein
LVFDDPVQVSRQDREVDGEERWQTIGMVGRRLFLVAHTIDEKNGMIRMISARRAAPQEEMICAQGY